MVVLDSQDFDAVVFDLDGTMVDNSEFHERAWREFLANHDISLSHEDFIVHIFGKHNEPILRHFFGELSGERLVAFAQEKEALYRDLYKNNIIEIRGLRAFLSKLAALKKKVAVATSAELENRTFVLKSLGLGSYFSVIVGSEHVERPKPAPDIYVETARQLGVPAERCVVFEDSPSGVEAGSAAGMRVIGVLTGYAAGQLGGVMECISSFDEVQIRP